MFETYEQNSKKKLAATIVAVLVIAGVIVLADAFKNKGPTTDSSTAQTASQTTASDSGATDTSTTDTSTDKGSDENAAASTGTYSDGTYSASSDYFVPHGTESIKVTVTLSGGTITDVSIANSQSDHDSAEYQEEFASSYKSSVVGKKINGLQISNVAGASDTTDGFNEALNQIATEAQA